ncbi:MAG: hypothetical protein ABI432_04140 [Flavobacteriales bacterium]
MGHRSRRRSPLYTGPDVEDNPAITPGTKADGTPKTLLNMAMYDDVDTIMDHIAFHFSQDLDAPGIEQAIRDEFEVINGDLGTLIRQNLWFCEQRGITPASMRRALGSKQFWLYMLAERLKQLLPGGLVGAVAGSLGALLFSHFGQQHMPPLLWSLRYFLLACMIMGAHITLRRIRRRYYTSYAVLAISSIGAAVAAVVLCQGL